MAAIHRKVLELSAADRQHLEAILVQFDLNWKPGALAKQLHALDADNPVRPAAAVELVKIDMEHHWRTGQRVHVEQYLEDFRELGDRDSVAAELIQAEYETRRQFGDTVTLSEYAQRFPVQSDQLQSLVREASELIDENELGQAVRATSSVADPATGTWPQKAADAGDRVGTALGRYRIEKVLGKGGMGAVYLAYDEQLERHVAFKVPHFSADDGPDTLVRFYREAKAAAMLSHENICPTFDVGEIDGVHYMTMAYVEGKPLSKLIANRKTWKRHRVAKAMLQLAKGLAEAHKHGIVHRDLKSANIMLNKRGKLIVMDFGLARRTNLPHDEESARLTQSGMIVGTPAYMSPEQVSGDPNAVGPSSDIYSLGVVMYELITGKLPFGGALPMVLAQIMTVEPKPPSEVASRVDAQLAAICLKAMAKDVPDRYTSMEEMAEHLQEYLQVTCTGETSGGDTPLPTIMAKDTAVERAKRRNKTPTRWRLQLARVVAGVYKRKWFSTSTAATLVGIACVFAITIYTLTDKKSDDDLESLRKRVILHGSSDISDPNSIRLRSELEKQLRLAGGKPAAVEVAQLMSKMRWPLDTLDPEKIDPYELTVAGWGDPARAPKGIVQIVGDSRLKHSNTVNAVTFSQDSRLVASCSEDGTIKIWEVETASETAALVPPTRNVSESNRVLSIAFSADGRMVASGHNDHKVRLWNVSTQALLKTFSGHMDVVKCVAFHPDGTQLASAGHDSSIRLWDPIKLKDDGVFAHCEKGVNSIAFSNDGKYLASGGEDKVVTVWDFAAKKVEKSLPGHKRAVTCVAFNFNGAMLASGSSDKTVGIWDWSSKSPGKFIPHGHTVNSVSFHPDGKQGVSGVQNGRIRFWSTKTRELESHSLMHVDSWRSVLGVCFAPDGTSLATCGEEGSVRIWDTSVSPPRSKHALTGQAARVHWRRAAMTLNGELVATTARDGFTCIWETVSGHGKKWRTDSQRPRSLTFSPDGKTLATARQVKPAPIKFWNVDDATRIGQLPGSWASDVAFSPDGETVAVAHSDGQFSLWTRDGIQLSKHRDIDGEFAPARLLFCPDGERLVFADSGGNIRTWDRRTEAIRVFRKVHTFWMMALAVSQDGHLLASADDRTLQIWEFVNREQFGKHLEHQQRIDWAAFSPDSSVVATVDSSGRIVIWDLARKTSVGEIKLGEGFEFRIAGMWFGPAGRHLITANRNGTVYVLRLSSFRPSAPSS